MPLLTDPVHELRQFALVVMSERARSRARRDGDPAEREQIYTDYLGHTAYVNNWDLVDLSAGPIVGGYLLDRDRAVLRPLADPDIALGAADRHGRHPPLPRGPARPRTSTGWPDAADDRHDLMHKAVGWSLREAGKRVDRDELRAFLDSTPPPCPGPRCATPSSTSMPPNGAHYLALGR